VAYRIEFSPLADSQIRRLSKSDLTRVASIIEPLRVEPRPSGAVLVIGATIVNNYLIGDIYRLEVGPYSMNYEVKDIEQLIIIASIVSGWKKTITNKIRLWFISLTKLAGFFLSSLNHGHSLTSFLEVDNESLDFVKR